MSLEWRRFGFGCRLASAGSVAQPPLLTEFQGTPFYTTPFPNQGPDSTGIEGGILEAFDLQVGRVESNQEGGSLKRTVIFKGLPSQVPCESSGVCISMIPIGLLETLTPIELKQGLLKPPRKVDPVTPFHPQAQLLVHKDTEKHISHCSQGKGSQVLPISPNNALMRPNRPY